MKVLILGLGQYPQGSGVEAAAYFARRGDEVIVTDLKTKKDLAKNVRRLSKYRNVRFVLGEHRMEDVRWADLVVPNPRVRSDNPFLEEAIKDKKNIESDISLFLASCLAPVIGVTGTRGKSTTAALMAEILKVDGHRTWLGGNILVSPLAFLDRVKKTDWVVLELSSWQLELTGRKGISPPFAVWTNLLRDHLNTYTGIEEYAEAKAQIFRHQGSEGVVFLPSKKSFQRYAETAPGEVVRIGRAKSEVAQWMKEMKMNGEHNQQNAECAIRVAQHLQMKTSSIKKALQTFKGLPHRQEEVAMIRGVRYINDTTATTPDATIAALKTYAFAKTIHLILGGADKELFFEEMARHIKKIKPKVYLLPGTAHEKIAGVFMKQKISWTEIPDLKKGMALIYTLLKPGDLVLLSPGCASFGLFRNEFHRGEVFVKIVKKWKIKI